MVILVILVRTEELVELLLVFVLVGNLVHVCFRLADLFAFLLSRLKPELALVADLRRRLFVFLLDPQQVRVLDTLLQAVHVQLLDLFEAGTQFPSVLQLGLRLAFVHEEDALLLGVLK